MQTIAEDRNNCLTILGDAGGRRYSDSILDMGIREALQAYQLYCARRMTFKQRVTGIDGETVILQPLPDGCSVLTARTESGVWLYFAEYRTEKGLELNCYGSFGSLPVAGDVLTLEVACPHMIKGLDGANMTTVPDNHALMLCTGAAGYAMRIRARSVTEVFGKRPEDREALSSQANRLIGDYTRELQQNQNAARDPLPRGEFPI
jgi:hypothetical protein